MLFQTQHVKKYKMHSSCFLITWFTLFNKKPSSFKVILACLLNLMYRKNLKRLCWVLSHNLVEPKDLHLRAGISGNINAYYIL